MKLRVFQSDHGDCVLIMSADGKRVLADGGVSGSYTHHVAPALNRLHRDGEVLDLVYLSHIDQDHIGGILKMMDDSVAWRVCDYQRNQGNEDFPEPDALQPPAVKAIWHNAFHDQLGRNAGAIEDMLAAHATVLSGTDDGELRDLGQTMANLATSKREAVLLSRRVGHRQLDIPLNEPYDGGLMYVSDPPTTAKVGSMRLTVIGPFAEDLAVLRGKWNAWLRSSKGKKQVKTIRKEMRRAERDLGWSEMDELIAPLLAQAKELGNREEVTPPNLASLMLLVEEQGKTVLMTGDGHSDDILAGLDAVGKLDGEGRMHVNVLKVQHHGSEKNIDKPFCKLVTADHYVFCGNGHSENPEVDVIDAIAGSRLGSDANVSNNPQAGGRFKIWFNSSQEVTDHRYTEHMKQVEKRIKYHEQRSDGRMRYFFLRNGSSFTLAV